MEVLIFCHLQSWIKPSGNIPQVYKMHPSALQQQACVLMMILCMADSYWNSHGTRVTGPRCGLFGQTSRPLVADGVVVSGQTRHSWSVCKWFTMSQFLMHLLEVDSPRPKTVQSKDVHTSCRVCTVPYICIWAIITTNLWRIPWSCVHMSWPEAMYDDLRLTLLKVGHNQIPAMEFGLHIGWFSLFWALATGQRWSKHVHLLDTL